MACRPLTFCGFLVFFVTGSVAQASVEQICDVAAAKAAQSTGVPVSVLRAITRTETGRSRANALQPWPWTVNMEGVGKWFESERAAQSYVDRHFLKGARSFDVGCFQINYRWHGENFASIEEMFDPVENAQYAARFLQRLHAETGDWSKAAGAYHSRTQKYADRYIARFDRIHAGLDGAAPKPMTVPRRLADARSGINAFPLLQNTGATGRFGSLVPLGGMIGQPILPLSENGS